MLKWVSADNRQVQGLVRNLIHGPLGLELTTTRTVPEANDVCVLVLTNRQPRGTIHDGGLS